MLVFSVTVVEGAVQQLIEDNDVVVGVKYKPKGEDNSKVNTRRYHIILYYHNKFN